MLGDFPRKQRSIALQLMKRFQNEQELSNITPPAEFTDDLQDMLQTYHSTKAHISVLTNSSQHNELLLHSPVFTKETQKWPLNCLSITQGGQSSE